MGGSSSPGDRWPFVARDAEVAALDALVVSGRGALIHGDAGVGKTRLLTAACEQAELAGWRVHRVAGSRALGGVPFGAFAGSLRESVSGGEGDRFSILQAALAELGAGGDAPVLLAIDDAHHLDEGAASLAELAGRSGLVVIAALRRGEPCPEPLIGLWKDDVVARIDLAPLDAGGVAAVLKGALGNPVESGARRRLHAKTGGNLLFLRELVRVGLTKGNLVQRGDVWMWDGPIGDAPAVADLVRARLVGLAASEREVVDVVSLGEPIGMELLVSLCGAESVRRCETDGIVVTERSGRRLEARLEHPLYADLVREAMSPTTLHRLAGVLADALLASGSRRIGDRLRAASLLVTSGAPVDVGLLLEAVKEAQSLADLDVAARLGRAAFDALPTADTAIDLAQTLFWRGQAEEAIALVSGADLSGAAPGIKARGAGIVAQAHFYALGDLDAAEGWIAEGLASGDEHGRSLLRGMHAQMLATAGRSADAVVEARAVLSDPRAPTPARAAAYSGMLPALAVEGRLTELAPLLAEAQALVAGGAPGFSDAADGTLIATFISGLFEGTLPQIDPIFEAFDEEALTRVDDPFRCIWVFLRGRSALAQGRLGFAIPTLQEAAAVLRRRDPGGMLGWCLASLAQATGATGDARSARAALAELERVHFSVMGNIDMEIGLARAWTAAAEGERSVAVDLALGTAHAMVERGDHAVGVLALHDAARLGAHPKVVIDALEGTRAAEGPVVAAMRRHVEALAHDDLDELEGVTDDFVAVAMPLLAAEAAACAVRLARARGLRVRTSDNAARASALLSECGPALTPMLETIGGREALSSLTRREQEVALMAARGTSKRAIGEQLGVSVRTVGNHINHVYGKLGISSREELAALLSLGSST